MTSKVTGKVTCKRKSTAPKRQFFATRRALIHEDVNGEKLTVKIWWIFGVDFSRFTQSFSRFIRDINGEKNISLLMIFFTVSFSRFTPSRLIGCMRRGRTLPKDVLLPSKHLLSTFYKTLPSKNPSKNLVFTENPYRCLLRTLLRSTCC